MQSVAPDAPRYAGSERTHRGRVANAQRTRCHSNHSELGLGGVVYDLREYSSCGRRQINDFL